jgi:hypothetical protein
MMTSPAFPDWPDLTGNQEPLYLLADDGDQTEADQCLEFAARIKRPQMPWQQDNVRGIMALDGEGLFLHALAADVATRQSGKTLTAAEIRILYGLFVRGERIILSAQRWSTAENTFKRIRRLIASRPSLDRRVTRWICSQGQASVELSNGASCAFITRSLDAGRGIDRVDLLIYDEAYHIRPADQAALSPTQLASKNPQTIYLSSAVNEEIHPFGHVLSGIRQRALDAIANGDTGTGLFYAEYAAPEPPEGCSDTARRALRESPETWRLASPSYGVIQTEAKMRKLLIELSPTDFEVECLGWGRWSTLVDGAQRAIDPQVWNALADRSPEVVDPYRCVVAVDRSPRSGVYVIAQAVRTQSGGGCHVEIGYMDKASPAEVVAALMDLSSYPDPSEILISAQSTANVLLPHLTDLIDVTVLNTSESAIAAEAFVSAIDAGQLSHTGQRVLDDSVVAGVKKPLSGGRFTWDCAPGGMITALVAASMAHYGALLQVPKVVRHTPLPMTDAGTGRGGDEGFLDLDRVRF